MSLRSIASLELLQVINARMESIHDDESSQSLFTLSVPVLEAMSEPAEKSRNGVRMHTMIVPLKLCQHRHNALALSSFENSALDSKRFRC